MPMSADQYLYNIILPYIGFTLYMLLYFLLLAQLIAAEIMIPHISAHGVTFYVNLSPPSGVFCTVNSQQRSYPNIKSYVHFIYIFN